MLTLLSMAVATSQNTTDFIFTTRTWSSTTRVFACQFAFATNSLKDWLWGWIEAHFYWIHFFFFRVSIPSQLFLSIQSQNTFIEILGDTLLMSGSRLHVQLVEEFLVQHHFNMLLLYISNAINGLVCLFFFHHS